MSNERSGLKISDCQQRLRFNLEDLLSAFVEERIGGGFNLLEWLLENAVGRWMFCRWFSR